MDGNGKVVYLISGFWHHLLIRQTDGAMRPVADRPREWRGDMEECLPVAALRY
jgi:hypothetical protein